MLSRRQRGRHLGEHMKNDTNTLYWLIAIGLWIMALIVGSCALTGCGGPEFVLDSPDAENNPEAGLTEVEAAVDAAPDHVVGLPRPDASPDAGHDADATPEADSNSDADAAPIEAGCAPFPTTVASCDTTHQGSNGGPSEGGTISYTIPAQYCVYLASTNGSPTMPVIMVMPAACRCAGPQSNSYTEACFTNELTPAMMCPAGSSFYGGGIAVDATRSAVLCREGDGG